MLVTAEYQRSNSSAAAFIAQEHYPPPMSRSTFSARKHERRTFTVRTPYGMGIQVKGYNAGEEVLYNGRRVTVDSQERDGWLWVRLSGHGESFRVWPYSVGEC